ncbi:MAG: SRPBCC family protein [Chitinophagales bacterium]
MKFSCKVEINASINKIVTELTKVQNMKKWMKGFQYYKLLKGDFFEEGSETIIMLHIAGKKIEMKEIILENNLPNSFKSKYETDGVINYVINEFEYLEEEKTCWIQHQEFRFNSLAVKMFSTLVVSIFKTFGKSILTDFKNFVESEN